MSDRLEIEPVASRHADEALRFLAGGRQRDFHVALRAEVYGEMLARAGRHGHLRQARRDRDVLAVAMVIPSVGRVGMLFHSPAEAAGVEAEALSAVMSAAARAGVDDGLAFVQALIDPRQKADADALAAATFLRLAELVYMRRDLARPVEPADLPGLTYRDCHKMDLGLLAQVVPATYERSLDCPLLAGMRQIDDVLESHKASGIWRPDCWWVAQIDGQPAGCVLVNDSANEPGDVDLVYMGVTARFRGRGVGRAMVRHVIGQAKDERREYMHVVVDASNGYAHRIYDESLFSPTHRRLAWILPRIRPGEGL